MKRQLLFSLAFLAWAGVFGQSKLSMKIVDDANQNPLAGATILVKPGNQTLSANGNGQAELMLASGTYELYVSFLGYIDLVEKVEVTSEDHSITIKMIAEVEELNTIEVSALRAKEDAPFSKTNLSKEEIVELDNGRDVPFVLEQTASVVTTSDAGAGVGYTNMRVRGSDITRVNVTVNGIPMNDPESHGVWWVNTPDLASSTSSMQLQRGVGTSTNGAGAFGASLNMQVGDYSDKAYGNIHLGGGSFNTQRATIQLGTGLINNHWWVSGRLSSITSDGYIDRARSDLKSHQVSAGYKNDKTTVRAVYFGGGEETYQAWNGVDAYTLENDRTFNSAGAIYGTYVENDTIKRNWSQLKGFYENEVDNYKQDHYQLHWNQELNDYWSMNISGHYTYGRGYYEQYQQVQFLENYNIDPVVIGVDTIKQSDMITRKWLDNDFYGAIFNFSYHKNDWNVVVGGGYHQYEGRHFGNVIWSRFASNTEINHEYYNSYSNKSDFNVYAKADYLLNERIKLFADLQMRNVEYSAKGTDDAVGAFAYKQTNLFFNPKVGLSFFVNENTRAYASYAVANKEPNRTDLIYSNPESLPEPENLQDVEFGVDFSTEKFSLLANIYYMNYNNQLVLTGELDNVGYPIRENMASSYRSGVELTWGVKPNDWFEWLANATLSQNKNLNYIEKDEDGNETRFGNTNIAYSPDIIAGSRLRFFPVEGLELELVSKYVGEQYLSNSDNSDHILPSYFLNDVRVSYALKFKSKTNMRFYVNAMNVFNTEYSSNGYTWGPYPYYYPQAGINFLGGIQLNF